MHKKSKMSRKIICIIYSLLFIVTSTMKVEANGEVQPDEKDYCSINDFEDFHYYLFCNTNIGTTAPSRNPTVNAFIGSNVETMEAGIELYQKFMEPFWENGYEEYMELEEISLNCQLVILIETETGGLDIWTFFDGKKEKEKQEVDICGKAPFRIVRSGEVYIMVDGEILYQKVESLDDETGYYGNVRFNEQGDLAAGDKIPYKNDTYEMSICDLENTEVLWTFYQGKEYGYVWQIQGDKESGKVVYQLGSRDFYEYTYPAEEIKYLGKDIYYPCYSPDGKYIAYSSPDMEACYDLDEEEAEEVLSILPGIYILEVATGKTAYIKQDTDGMGVTLDSRRFQWVEKDCFEKVMEERK